MLAQNSASDSDSRSLEEWIRWQLSLSVTYNWVNVFEWVLSMPMKELVLLLSYRIVDRDQVFIFGLAHDQQKHLADRF